MDAISRLARGLLRIGIVSACVALPVVPIVVAENAYGHEGGVVAAIAMLATAGLVSAFVLAWGLGKS